MSKQQQHSQFTQKIQNQVKHEISQMKDYSEQTHQIITLIKGYKTKGEDLLKRLLNQLTELNAERKKHQQTLKQLEDFHKKELMKGTDLKNEYIQKKKQRVALAQKLDIKALNIDDRKSTCHDVFKWILSVVYKQPVGKYYWGNFKQQAFKQDKGVDFKERMGKIPALEMKQDEKVATQKLVGERDKLINHEDFKQNVRQTIKSIIQIANLMFEGAQIAKKMKQLQSQDTQSKDQNILKQQMFKKSQAKCSAVQDRINLNQKYLHLLNDIQTQMTNKGKYYDSGNKQGSKVLSELKSLHSQNFKSTYVDTTQKSPQSCLLF